MSALNCKENESGSRPGDNLRRGGTESSGLAQTLPRGAGAQGDPRR